MDSAFLDPPLSDGGDFIFQALWKRRIAAFAIMAPLAAFFIWVATLDPSTGFSLGMVALFAPFGLFFYRLATLGFEAKGDELRVRGLTRTYVIEVGDIDHFVILPGEACAYAVQKDGERRIVAAIAPNDLLQWLGLRDKRAEASVAVLNAWLDRRRAVRAS